MLNLVKSNSDTWWIPKLLRRCEWTALWNSLRLPRMSFPSLNDFFSTLNKSPFVNMITNEQDHFHPWKFTYVEHIHVRTRTVYTYGTQTKKIGHVFIHYQEYILFTINAKSSLKQLCRNAKKSLIKEVTSYSGLIHPMFLR